MSGNYRHGGSGTRLYKCWKDMKDRTKTRDNCKLHVPWEDFVPFRDWAMENGHKEHLQLCRNGDVGEYSPNNARWDTIANNIVESRAKHYKFLFEGCLVEVYNLEKFGRDGRLNASHLGAVHSGKRKSHKGYTKWQSQHV